MPFPSVENGRIFWTKTISLVLVLKPKLAKCIVVSNEFIQFLFSLLINKGRNGWRNRGCFITTIFFIQFEVSSDFRLSSEIRIEIFEYFFIFSIDDLRTFIPPRDFIPQALINTLFTYKQF